MGCSVALFVYVFCQDNMALVGLAISSFFCKNTWNLPPPIKFAEKHHKWASNAYSRRRDSKYFVKNTSYIKHNL